MATKDRITDIHTICTLYCTHLTHSLPSSGHRAPHNTAPREHILHIMDRITDIAQQCAVSVHHIAPRQCMWQATNHHHITPREHILHIMDCIIDIAPQCAVSVHHLDTLSAHMQPMYIIQYTIHHIYSKYTQNHPFCTITEGYPLLMQDFSTLCAHIIVTHR